MHNGASLLTGLNEAQREAATAVTGAVLVVAGPGTGKTRTLTVRLAHLVHDHGITLDSLLALTFTTRAAREMTERLEPLLGEHGRRLTLGTFHALCHRLLRREGHRLELPAEFNLCAPGEQLAALQQSLDEVDEPPLNGADAQQLLQRLSYLRNRSGDSIESLQSEGLWELFKHYRTTLRRRQLLDFDDLLSLTVTLLENHPEVTTSMRERYRYLAVDEYQDVNPMQYRLLTLVAGEQPNLWAVGDADQAIYAFRGAEVENFLRFEQEFPAARTIRLSQGYRSSPQIVTAAGQVIAHNRSRLPFILTTQQPDGALINRISVPNEKAEAEWIVGVIEEQVGGTSHYRHYRGQVQDTASRRQGSFRDFAVLYRLNALSRPLEEALHNAGIPYRRLGERRLSNLKGIRELLAYLRVIHQHDDSDSLNEILNIPPRGIGAKTEERLRAETERRDLSLYAVLKAPPPLPSTQHQAIADLVSLLQELRSGLATRPLSTFITWLLEASNLITWAIDQNPRRESDFLRLRALAAQYDDQPTLSALENFLAEVALSQESDEYDPTADSVTLMSLHAAKGLEFNEVFICGVEEELIPYQRDAEENTEEERRLFYVGMTRARARLHLLNCRSRFLFGQQLSRKPSRFLNEFDTALQKEVSVADPKLAANKQKLDQLSLF